MLAPLAPCPVQIHRKKVRAVGVGEHGGVLLSPIIAAKLEDAARNGLHGREIARAQVAMRMLLLALLHQRAEASGGG